MDFIFSTLADILHILKIFIICKCYLLMRENNNKNFNYCFSLIITVLSSNIIYYCNNKYLDIIVFLIAVIIIQEINYNENKLTKIISCIWSIFVIEIINLIFMLTLDVICKSMNVQITSLSNFIAEIGSTCFIILIAWSLNRIDKNRLKNVNIRYLIMITAIMFWNVIIMELMAYSVLTETIVRFKLLYTITFTFVAISIYVQIAAVLLLVVSRNLHKEKEKVINQYLEEQINHYEYLNERETQTKKFRHDIRSHLYLLKKLKDEKKYDEYDKYFDEIIERIDSLGNKINVGNDIVNAIINKAYSDAMKNHVEMYVKGHFPNICNIKTYDLCTIFSNLLNNALEGAINSSEKKIWVLCQYTNNDIIIEIGNYYNGIITIKENKVYTSKSQKELHGWGLENVNDSVKIYDGLMDIATENQKFIVTVTLNNAIETRKI